MLCCGYTLTDFPISIRLTSLALWQSNDCPSASKATLMNMDKHFMWIHYERLHNHNKAKHNKTVCIFLGIYCTASSSNWHQIKSSTLIISFAGRLHGIEAINAADFSVLLIVSRRHKRVIPDLSQQVMLWLLGNASTRLISHGESIAHARFKGIPAKTMMCVMCRFVISKSDLNTVTRLPMFSMLFIII